MLQKNLITLSGFLGLAVVFIAASDSAAQPGGRMQGKGGMMQGKGGMMQGKGGMMQGKGGMMQGMGGMMQGKGGMMQCCEMMEGGQKSETDHVHDMTMACCQMEKGELCDMLKSDKAEERFSAALAIGEKGLPLTGELIGLLTDNSDPVRQAARRSLILSSYHLDAMKKANKRGAVPNYVDFGPMPNANQAAQKKSAKAWSNWAAKNEKDLKSLEQVLGPTLAAAQIEHTKDSLDKVKTSLQANQAIILDVREQSEWDGGHLKLAQLLPLSKLKEGIPASDLAKILPKDKTIYAHCGSGRRVLEAAEILHQAGYHIEPLKTGYADLIKAGFEKAAK